MYEENLIKAGNKIGKKLSEENKISKEWLRVNLMNITSIPDNVEAAKEFICKVCAQTREPIPF